MPEMRFEIAFTYKFIKRHLPCECKRVLEVGCGTGELAACLSQDGFEVIAIDADQESVDIARQLGVDAHVAEWPHFNCGRVDAVLFTRSLHHIRTLPQAVQAATECLPEGGRIIVEDFAYDSADERTLRWFTSVSRIIDASGLLLDRNGLLDELLSSDSSLPVWRNHHDHDLNTAADMAAVLDKLVDHVFAETAPYLFRYFAKALAASDRRDPLLRALCEHEMALIDDGAIAAIGRRFVATRAVSRDR
jgi:SAM-dependent methyltransferase